MGYVEGEAALCRLLSTLPTTGTRTSSSANLAVAQSRASIRSVDSDQGSSDDSKDIIIIGLAVVVGVLALVVLGLLGVLWRCKRGASSAGGAPAQPQPATTTAGAPTVTTAPPPTASASATTGTVEPNPP